MMIRFSYHPRFFYRNRVLTLVFLVGIFTWNLGNTEDNATPLVQRLPGELKWQENPKLHGLQTSILVGDPTKPEPYAERIKIPAHFKLNPHSHSNSSRMVTVLAGTLYHAFGDQFDESKLEVFPPGSFFTEPENRPHYGLTKDEEVILQLNAVGPADIRYVETPTIE
jgi:quercetin dioxygenase-like cupin family protein